MVKGIKAYKEYLSHQKFTVYTDHQALKWLNFVKDTSTRLGRWAIHLQEYQFDIVQFDIVHKAGRVHKNADVLSRRTYETDDTSNLYSQSVSSVQVSSPEGTSREYFNVNFSYGRIPSVSAAKLDDINADEAKQLGLEDKSVSDLQRECKDFRHMFAYLENGILPDEKKLASNIFIVKPVCFVQ